ncbi:MAG: hypothetical protein OEX22_03200 [Cyclobacteriaceae bacterium]|nr:hypothetical protein [Cyclobacteriaceae bacterium]
MRKITSKIFASISITLVILFLFSACYKVPSFPDTPSISFDKVEFNQVGTNTDVDSLLISISFKDGDGDLGLDGNYTTGDFSSGNYFEDNQGNLITFNYSRLPEYQDLLPPFELPYSCTNWHIKPTIDGVVIEDTLYFEPNINQYNIFVDFLYKNTPSEEFVDFDWVTDIPQPCGLTIDGRFPVLQKEGDGAAIEGHLTYGFVSVGLIPLFNDKILKLRIQIQDRALNKSNIVESPEFTLKEIQVN